MLKRIKLFAIAIIIILCIYIVRLMQLQLLEPTHFSKKEINLIENSIEKRGQSIVIDEGRGHFLYSDGSSMVYEKKEAVVIFPFTKKKEINWSQLAKIVDVEESDIKEQLKNATAPFVLNKNGQDLYINKKQMNEINELQISGIYGVEMHDRLPNRLADHLIGITGENVEVLRKRYPYYHYPINTLIGLSGLEKSFDYFLVNASKSKLVYYVDNNNNALFGEHVKYVAPANPFYPLRIVTTINKEIQKEIEDIISASFITKGGAILIDVSTNDIVATISVPSINHNNPFDLHTGSAQNEMFREQIIGSVFKPVVTAAAIETLNLDFHRRFDCNKNILGKVDPNYQYGMLDVTDSFAKSCNNTFGTLSKELNPDALNSYAIKLGLIGPISWLGEVVHHKNFKQIEEDKGRVFLKDSPITDPNFLAQTGIGQQEVRATPLGVANMMATIARGGENKAVRVVKEIQYKNGAVFFKFPTQTIEDKKVTPITAMKLQRLLREVVMNGTAKQLNDSFTTIAGKTGTAELDKVDNNQQPLYNKWMAGYFPFEEPKYALVVVSLETKNPNEKVNMIFKQIVEAISLEKEN